MEPKTNIRENDSEEGESRSVSVESLFADLAPYEDADLSNGYLEALNFAMQQRRISNIALSGPYGSGKSSIIKTYENTAKLKFLNISLASFSSAPTSTTSLTTDLSKDVKSPSEPKAELNELERSILQQILYGESNNKLRYSRLKRIKKPRHPVIKSILFVLWFLNALYIYQHRAAWFLIDFDLPISGIKIVGFLGLIAGLIYIFHTVYTASFGYSISKVSLKNGEIETETFSETSILNSYLDEILYFFSETDYHGVVFEDLDRFDNTEIFAKLREINKLVNERSSEKEVIKFIYAVKDDLFETERLRTKFFDFIIPVIPVVNTTNSYDKLYERLISHEIGKKIDIKFLKEVSIYLTDLRLIKNIVNEMIVYHGRLKSLDIDCTKLLAVLIYKNVYHNDFAKLHQEDGILYKICHQKGVLADRQRFQFEQKISDIREKTRIVEKEQTKSLENLVREYAAEIMALTPAKSPDYRPLGVRNGDIFLRYPELLTIENFEKMIDASEIHVAIGPNNNANFYSPTGKSFKDIERKVDAENSYLERKSRILDKGRENQKMMQEQVSKFQAQIRTINKKKLFELLRDFPDHLTDMLDLKESSKNSLLSFLVTYGYIDETYDDYISNFYDIRMKRADRLFILKVRNSEILDADFQIETPAEVVEDLDISHFDSLCVLNVILIDHMLESPGQHEQKLSRIIDLLLKRWDESESFLLQFYDSAKNIESLFAHLVERRDILAKHLSASVNSTEHLFSLLCETNDELILEVFDEDEELKDCLAEDSALMLTIAEHYNSKDKPLDVFSNLELRVPEIKSFENSPKLEKFLLENCLLELNVDNLRRLFVHFTKDEENNSEDFFVSNYTSILKSQSQSLLDFVDQNLPEYIENVYFKLGRNTKESEESFVALLNKNSITEAQKSAIISSQESVISCLYDVPTEFHTEIFEQDKIQHSWQTLAEFLSSTSVDIALAAEKLNNPLYRNLLIKSSETIGEISSDIQPKLLQFLLEEPSIEFEALESLSDQIPKYYLSIPADLPVERKRLFAKEGKLFLSADTYKACKLNVESLVFLITHNLEEYFSNVDQYPLSDTVIGKIVTQKIDEDSKRKFLTEISSSELEGDPTLSEEACRLFLEWKTKFDNPTSQFFTIALKNVSDLKLATEFLAEQIWQFSDAQLHEIIPKLPSPLSKIGKPYARVILPYSDSAVKLAKSLKSDELISSWKVKGSVVKINNKLSLFFRPKSPTPS